MSDKSAEDRRDPAVLRALLDRVQAAEGPDRELGVRALVAVGGWRLLDDGPGRDEFVLHDETGKRQVRILSGRGPATPWDHANPAISIDACVTLLRHALPQSFWSVCDMEDGPVAILVRPTPVGYIGGGVHGKAATPPLAFLAALLKSLIANAEEGR